MPPTPLLLASSNPGKLQEFQGLLAGIPTWEVRLLPPGVDLPETGTSFRDNAIQKAQTAARHFGQWSLADDSGLCVAALGGAPGVYSARYGRSDAERIAKLLAALEGVRDRRAYFAAALVICDPTGQVRAVAEGYCHGEITTAPRGTGGFGYNPIFYVPEQGLTFAEMTVEQRRQLSHRGIAWQALLPQLLALP
ncbi:MAG: RdgB/HAM1 family non-canonical purine NTP pyrophosphatase [Thermostichales cyanobacterium SZTDM-1c_bins_54]